MRPTDTADHDPFARLDGESEPADWIESVAEAEGIDAVEAAKRLVSTYWTFKEMTSLLEHSRDGAGMDLTGAIEDAASAEDGEAGEAGDIRESAEPEVNPAVRAELDDIDERLDEIVDRVDDRHSTLEHRLDEELGHVEDIFEYLIDRTDAFEADLLEIHRAQAADRERRVARRRLVALKRRAGTLGVRRAECGECGEAVDLGVLTAPECPSCSSPFETVTPGSRWPGLGGPTLETRTESRRDSEAGPRGPRESSDHGTDAGFVWGEDRD